MQTETYHLFLLALAGLGQTFLLVFAWGFLVAVLLQKPLFLSYSVSHFLYERPSETTLVVTLIGTVLTVATTSCFSISLREAWRHHMHKPIPLVKLIGGIALAKGEFFFSFRHGLTTLVTLGMFGLTKLLVSSWATLLTPTLVANNVTTTGQELDLSSNYFDLQLGQQLVSSGSALIQGNSTEILDNDGLLSGIAAAQHSFGVSGVVTFNGVLYDVSTGGILPLAPGYLGSSQTVLPNNVGLNFAGGSVPSHVEFPNTPSLFDNYTIVQQGLTADVACYQVNSQTISQLPPDPLPVANFTGFTSAQLEALVYYMPCSQGEADFVSVLALQLNQELQGTSSSQSYVIQQTQQANTTGILSTLVCPYPLGQSNAVVNWSTFHVTSVGNYKYSFLQSTTCEITPKLTTSLVTYASGSVNAVVMDSTALSPHSNLALFLASIINYQSSNSQGLVSNSIGDALYSIAVTTNTSLSNGGPMDPRLLRELEQYWRGGIEFFGTYLRSGFSAPLNSIPSEASSTVNATHTIVTMGWSKRKPTYLYTVLPVTFFALLTYAAIGYSLWHILFLKTTRCEYATFDPTNPLHLIMVSSTRVHGEKEEQNLEGEKIGGFDTRGIADNENLMLQLEQMGPYKRFKNCTPATKRAASGDTNGANSA